MYDRGHRGIVAIACAGAFLAFLDATIVNIAFPDISRSFAGSGRDALSWVLDGYFVVIAALLVPAGGLADRFGHKRIFLLGVTGFTAASLLCAVAPSLELLIAFRVLQGIGAAMIAPTSLALVLDAFPPERRAAGVGLWGAAAAAAAAVGPTLGGALVELSDWRLVFLVNLPIGAAVVLLGRKALRERPQLDSRLPDLPGALMLALSLALVTLAIVEGNDWGWTSTATLGCFAAAAILLGAMIWRSRTHPRPIVEPALFAPSLLSHRQPRHPALRRRLLLADPRQRRLPHLDLGLHRAPGRRRDAAGADPLDARRRSRRAPRRPLRPPRRDRPRHAASSPPG